ncbi:hypothetical protein HK102_000109 [Quaeritorhiza haematococci]|nr:hypothetical protein HK102_000109 [Quaeritorhiza haematococci]
MRYVAYHKQLDAVPELYSAEQKENRLITTGIWTIHFGLDDDMYGSHARMANVIRELELDVVGLLESDTYRIIMGNRDLTQFLAEDLGMYADYGPSPTKHTWGCTMLSKFPILRSEHVLLPSPVGELACAIYATLDVHGTEVDVIVSHNGQEEDWQDRLLQTTVLTGIMRNATFGAQPGGRGSDVEPPRDAWSEPPSKTVVQGDRPFVFLGYVVTKPGREHELYRKFVEESAGMRDVDPSDWDRWCQYIFYRGVKRVAYARVSHGRITDTEIQAAKFLVPPPQDSYTAELKAIYNPATPNDVMSEGDVPEWRRFPQMFRGEGVRGHRYHVFNEPRYYR